MKKKELYQKIDALERRIEKLESHFMTDAEVKERLRQLETVPVSEMAKEAFKKYRVSKNNSDFCALMKVAAKGFEETGKARGISFQKIGRYGIKWNEKPYFSENLILRHYGEHVTVIKRDGQLHVFDDNGICVEVFELY